jgi:hypothetical protein
MRDFFVTQDARGWGDLVKRGGGDLSGAVGRYSSVPMNRRTWGVRDNGFLTNVTRLVRGSIEDLREVLAPCLGCHEVGLSMDESMISFQNC